MGYKILNVSQGAVTLPHKYKIMRTIIRKYKVYPIAELSEKAIEKAYIDWSMTSEYYDYNENKDTLEKFSELFGIKCYNWTYDAYTYSFRFDMEHNEEVQKMKGIRLATYITNNYGNNLYTPKMYYNRGYKKKRKSRIFTSNSCVLTGYYLDEDILEDIYTFLNRPDAYTSFHSLICKCLNKYFASCRDDVSYRQSEECFKEASLANEWEYLTDGTLFI